MIHSIQLLSHLDSIITAALRIYAVGGELFSIGAILVTLNFIATMIQRTYQAGYAIGTVYWRHLHKPLRWLLIHLVALCMLLFQLALEGLIYVYEHRKEISNTWNRIESAFIYESPTLV